MSLPSDLRSELKFFSQPAANLSDRVLLTLFSFAVGSSLEKELGISTAESLQFSCSSNSDVASNIVSIELLFL